MATTVEAKLGAVARESDGDLTIVENVADALGLSDKPFSGIFLPSGRLKFRSSACVHVT
jgi:hypothetical protein